MANNLKKVGRQKRYGGIFDASNSLGIVKLKRTSR
jgi:hypothetical protein